MAVCLVIGPGGRLANISAKSSQTLESYLAELEYLLDWLDVSPSVINKRPVPAIKVIPPPAAIGKGTPAGVDPWAEKSADKPVVKDQSLSPASELIDPDQ